MEINSNGRDKFQHGFNHPNWLVQAETFPPKQTQETIYNTKWKFWNSTSEPQKKNIFKKKAALCFTKI